MILHRTDYGLMYGSKKVDLIEKLMGNFPPAIEHLTM